MSGKKTKTKKGKVGGRGGAAKGKSQVISVEVHREEEEEVAPPPPPVASQGDADLLDESLDLVMSPNLSSPTRRKSSTLRKRGRTGALSA